MKKILSLILSAGLCLAAMAQGVPVSGVVVDSAGQPIVGAFVVERGTTNGTTTGLDGDFSIRATEGATLEVSCIGYESQNVTATGARALRVVLKDDAEMLEETVVIGYGVQKKSVVTASISKVDGDALNTVRASTINDALKGKVSGVQITQASGQPGSGSQIKIRGIGSVNNSDPLYIVDGMPVDGGIDYLNPTDIASVEILKDAASAAIYGARAANGVVLVTTRSGKKGQASVTYSGSYGWQNPWRKKEVLNATEYMVIMNEARINDGGTPLYSAAEIAAAGMGTDWQDQTFYYNAPITQHQLSVSGGTDKALYFVSVGYFNQAGIVGGNYGKSNYDRLTLRSNNTYVPFETESRNFLNKLTLTANIAYSNINSTGITTNSEFGSILGSAVAFNPSIPVFASEAEAAAILAAHPTAIVAADGRVYSLPPTGYQELTNPVANLDTPSNTLYKTHKFVANFGAELDILPGLKFKSSFGADLAFWRNRGYGFEQYKSSMNQTLTSWVNMGMNEGLRWQVENYFSYSKQLGKHYIAAVLGQSAMSYSYTYVSGTDYQLKESNPAMAYIDSAIGSTDDERTSGGTGGYDVQRLASYFFRFDYNFDERYMVEFTIRRDGSSRFGPGHKWATFPAASLGWNISNEPWFKAAGPSWIDQLKLRFGVGVTGNSSVGPYGTLGVISGYWMPFSTGNSFILVTNEPYYSSGSNKLPNKKLSWEKTTQYNIGLDFSLLRGRINGAFDVYTSKTNDLLLAMSLPSLTGYPAMMDNIGKTKNKGFDLTLNFIPVQLNDFEWNSTINAAWQKDEIVELANGKQDDINNAWFIGESISVYYGFESAGLWQEGDQAEMDKFNANGAKFSAGNVRPVDQNGDYKIDADDRVILGNRNPRWTLGWSNSFSWKGLELNIDLFGRFKYKISTGGEGQLGMYQQREIDYYTPNNTGAEWQKPIYNQSGGDPYAGLLGFKDASFIKIRNLSLGYRLDKQLCNKIGISGAKLYVQGKNLGMLYSSVDFMDLDTGTTFYNRGFTVGLQLDF